MMTEASSQVQACLLDTSLPEDSLSWEASWWLSLTDSRQADAESLLESQREAQLVLTPGTLLHVLTQTSLSPTLCSV